MKLTKQQRKEWWRKVLFKAAVVLVSTFVIVYFMPRDESFSYEYQENKPWLYGQLIAPFRFPIYKDEAIVKREKDSVMRQFQPYYNLDKKTRINIFREYYNTTSKSWNIQHKNYYIRHIARHLDTIYTRGILSVTDYGELEKNDRHFIKIINGNEATTYSLRYVFTTHTAYEYIINADTSLFDKQTMQSLNLMDFIKPNLQIDQVKSETEKNLLLSNVAITKGIVESGEKIIGQGEKVTAEKVAILDSYKKEISKHKVESQAIPFNLIGQIFFVLAILLTLISYLNLFRVDYFDRVASASLLFGTMVFFCSLSSLMVSHKLFHIMVVPLCMLPIIIRVFMDSRTAFMFHCATVAIISLTLENPYIFFLLQIAIGMIAIQSLRELSQRSQIIRTAALIAFSYATFYTAYELIMENDYAKIDTEYYKYIIVNAILLLFTYPLLYLLERVFGFVSDVTLVELSNINNPLLQRMTEIAPGTFQHSMQVANLSAEVARKIGGKAQLVRTAALYHDIGKIERPAFFTENQSGISPHKHLTPQKSAEVIIAHVNNGLALASKYNLPKVIKDFISSHHGRGIAKYFYITYKNEHPDEEVDMSIFTYPGPNPSTKEEAILMMCDSVEAASRSLPEYTEESIANLVSKIIDGQMAEGFFRECDITFRDIEMTKLVLTDKLKTIYHTRISYPELESTNKK